MSGTAEQLFVALFKVASQSSEVQLAKEAAFGNWRPWQKALALGGAGLGLGGLGYLGGKWAVGKGQESAEQDRGKTEEELLLEALKDQLSENVPAEPNTEMGLGFNPYLEY